MRMPLRLAAVMAALWLASVGAAQDVASRPESRAESRGAETRKKTLTVTVDGPSFLDGDATYLIQGVRIRYGDLDIRCDEAIVWTAKESERASAAGDRAPDSRGDVKIGFGMKVKEVYAHGNVLIRQGEEVFGCLEAFFDLVHERGIVVEPNAKFPIPTQHGEKGTLSMQAAELRMLSQFQMEAIGARISTCPYGNPHYHIASEKVDIYRARAREGPTQADGEPTPNFYYTGAGNTLFIGSGFPVLWLPDVSGSSTTPQGNTLRYVKDVRFGKSSQFGWEPGITLGDELRDKKGKKWGTWLLDLDYLSKRGAGIGVDFAYERPGFYKGEIQTSYQHDRGEDEFYGKPPSENRWRYSMRHRTYLPNEFQLDFEINAFSDRGYYPTYYEDEFKQDKPPETYLYLKRAFQNSAVTGLYSTRVNDWETLNEYQPRLEYLLITEPLFDVLKNPVYLTARAELSRPKTVFDEEFNLPNLANVRADIDTLLEYPFQAGPVKLTPFAGIRETYYELDMFRNPDQLRTGFTYGAEAAMIMSRNFSFCGGIFQLDGLRHIIEPSVVYRRTTGVDLHPEELVAYDDVDTFDDVESVQFRLRNLFQTIRHAKNQAVRVEEVFDLELTEEYFPQAERDNRGYAWSNLRGQAVLRFSEQLQFASEFEYSFRRSDLEVFDFAAVYLPSEKLQLYAGFRHFSGQYDNIYGQINWRASDKWLLRAYSAYDLADDKGVQDDFVLSRIGHDWVFSVVLGADFGEEDFTFGIVLEPRIFFDPVLRPAGRRREPEFNNLGTWVNQ